jgi:hypothetical protein
MKSSMIFVLLLGIAPGILFSQAAPADSSRTGQDSTTVSTPERYEEFILETIRIEAVIEKPSVTLIPKKIETDVGQLPFGNRSFEKELNAMPEMLKDYRKDLEEGKRIKKFKKKLAKETE